MIYKGNTEISPAPYRDAAGKEILLIQTSGALTNYKIPAGTTSIKPYCFYMYNNLQHIYIPNTVVEIFEHAFEMATALEEINLPDGVKILHDDTFKNCSHMAEAIFGGEMTSWGSGVFRGCVELTSIDIPSGLQQIPTNAFNGCSGLNTVNIPSSVKVLQTYAFSDCTLLANVNIAPGLESIGQYCFNNCSHLEHLTLPEGVKTLNIKSFYQCGLKTISLPNTLTRIDGSFEKAQSLETITIPDSVTYIGNNSFTDCSNLTYVKLPNNPSFTQINRWCFNGCLKLKTIVMNDYITTIETSAFERTCFDRIEIPASCTTINKYAFKDINVPEETHIIFKGKVPAFSTSYNTVPFTFTGNGVVNITIKSTDDPMYNGGLALSEYKQLGDPSKNEMHIYVPANLVDAYKAEGRWTLYWDYIEADPETV